MKHHALMMIAILVVAGCSSPDERLSRLVRDTTAAQSSQNQRMSELNQEAAANHRAVIESVEQSRQDILQLERDLQQQRDRIDEERRSLANERQRESILGPVFSGAGLLLVAALPLVLCWYLLHGLQSDDSQTSEVLLQEILREQPLLSAGIQQEKIRQQPADDDCSSELSEQSWCLAVRPLLNRVVAACAPATSHRRRRPTVTVNAHNINIKP